MVHRLGVVAALAALTVTGAARAEEGTGVKSALSAIGLIEPERPAINYRERPPLVLPPKGTLPPPQASLREADPAWPKDPEAVVRARAAAEARKPITRGEGGRLTDPPTGYRKPPGGRLAKTNGDPVGIVNPDRQESDPGAYLRSQRR